MAYQPLIGGKGVGGAADDPLTPALAGGNRHLFTHNWAAFRNANDVRYQQALSDLLEVLIRAASIEINA
jgi:hypothetical protein